MKLFLLAHQDDEVFFVPHLLTEERKLIVFLTCGVASRIQPAILMERTEEAKCIFEKHLAPLNSEVIWMGLDNVIPEGELHKYINHELVVEIIELIQSRRFEITEVLTTTFEGAHQDHDSAAVIARRIAKELQVEVVEISTYPQWFSHFYSFKVLSPKYPNIKFNFNRLKSLLLALKLMSSYKTQRRTWLALGLGVLWVYGFRPYASSRPMAIGTINSCFYELRERRKQTEVLRSLARFDSF